MKTIAPPAVAALVAASLALGTMAPTLAQDAAPVQARPAEARQDVHPGAAHRHGHSRGDLLSFDRGAEAVEVAIVRLGHRLDLTDDQKILLDTLRTDALAAAETFETETAGLRPSRADRDEAATPPDVATRFQNRISLQAARLAALEAVQPAFVAFFESLTEEQRAALMPQPGERRPIGRPAGDRDIRHAPPIHRN